MTTQDKLIKTKLGLLNLANKLQNEGFSCKKSYLEKRQAKKE